MMNYRTFRDLADAQLPPIDAINACNRAHRVEIEARAHGRKVAFRQASPGVPSVEAREMSADEAGACALWDLAQELGLQGIGERP